MSKRVYVTLDDDLYEIINTEASRRRLSMAAVMRDILAGHYNEQLEKLAIQTKQTESQDGRGNHQ
jgi:hypothetical protein